ncbi:MAG: RagB/SusD family nutrient uptake outer membrane protein, partial [Bacteroidales bacterium]|nr:RagB/SusD family nutrient uptake outer membrane protein [Bacteroidales bacterium]
MMKRLNTFFLLAMAALTMASCNILDLTPDGRETLADIFADNDKTAAYLNSCYGNIHPKGANYNWVCNAPTALCDEGWLSYGVVTTVPSELYEGAATATAHP